MMNAPGGTLKGTDLLPKERFGRFAAEYVASDTHAKGAELGRLVELAEPQSDWEVLDIATGGGHTALVFSPHVARVRATDISPTMLEAARAFVFEAGTTNVEFRIADAEALPFEIESFNLVTCRVAAHHFQDPGRFVREAARVLRPGGMLLVQDHLAPEDSGMARYLTAFEKLRDPSHHRAYSESEWSALLQGAGVPVVHAEQVEKRHLFEPWAQRQRCTPDTVAQLVKMVEEAPPEVRGWMRPTGFGTPQAAFVDHHIIVAGRRSHSPRGRVATR